MARHLMKKLVAAAALTLGIQATAPLAAESGVELLHPHFHHDGIFGSFDRAAVQRGFQIYRQVCSSCHGLKYLAFRNLADIGYEEEQIKAIAAEYTVQDGPNNDGDMFDRPGMPADHVPSPFANEKAARAAMGGALPPDLSLITKAREHGPAYVFSLLLGYVDPPADFTLQDGMNYNAYFAGHQIAMAQPLMGDDVEFQDGTAATLEQEAHDVVTFLHWVAEPNLEQRKQTGIKAIIFLVIFCGIFYAYKRRVWADLH